MPSICCLFDIDTVPGIFFFPKVLGHQQIVGYQIPPFRLILETSLSFPNSTSRLVDKKSLGEKTTVFASMQDAVLNEIPLPAPLL